MNQSTHPLLRSIATRLGRGVAAGAAGTIAMDMLGYRRYRHDNGRSSLSDWEFRTTSDGFDDAPAPARVGKWLASAAHIDLPDSAATVTNNVVHWTTGLIWGTAAATLHCLPRVRSVEAGVLTGFLAFATSYAVLPKLGIYRKITSYDARTLAHDLSAHVVFGVVAGTILTGG
jgi:hypothetical protein